MNQIKKIIFRTSIIFIGLWILMPLIRWILDLDFTTDSIKSNYKEFMFFAVPIALLLTLFGTIKTKDSRSKIAGKVIGTIAVTFATIFIMVMSIFADMCIWTNRQVLYESKHDSKTKIVVRDFGCGATDSGPPIIGVYKIQYITYYFIRTTKIDTAKIEKDEWIKIK